jgi:hypothetical protein
MELHLNIIGVLLILLGLAHIGFPRYFKWKEDLKPLSTINKQMMLVHTFFIALIVLLMGVLCLTSSKQLIETDLGKKISLGLAIFWTTRLIIQFFGYSPKLWKGKLFETIIHIAFSLFWAYMSLIFVLIFI